MAYFAVQYLYADDPEAIALVRPGHREFLAVLTDGPLVASGPYVDAPRDSALLLLRAASAAEVASILDRDPFWEAGLIVERSIVQWNPLIGVFATG